MNNSVSGKRVGALISGYDCFRPGGVIRDSRDSDDSLSESLAEVTMVGQLKPLAPFWVEGDILLSLDRIVGTWG